MPAALVALPQAGRLLVRSRDSNAKRVVDANSARLHLQLLTLMYVEGQPRLQPRPPLPHHRLPPGHTAHRQRQPRYVFDLLHFPEPDPQLRQLHQQTIQRVVGSTMVINSMDDAVHYRRLLQNHNLPVPALLALRDLKVLFADNTEQLGTRSFAPPLHAILPRLGVQPVGVQRLMSDVQAARSKVEAINRETADLRQQWAASSWAEKEARLRQATQQRSRGGSRWRGI